MFQYIYFCSLKTVFFCGPLDWNHYKDLLEQHGGHFICAGAMEYVTGISRAVFGQWPSLRLWRFDRWPMLHCWTFFNTSTVVFLLSMLLAMTRKWNTGSWKVKILYSKGMACTCFWRSWLVPLVMGVVLHWAAVSWIPYMGSANVFQQQLAL